MKHVWIVEYIDDDEDSTQKASFTSYNDAMVWIEFRQNSERYEKSGFQIIAEPYEADPTILKESMSKSQKEDFYAKLQKEKVHFQYHKKDGSVRKAYGTLIPEELPSPRHKSDTRKSAREKLKRTLPDHLVLYYDLNKKGFRSFMMKLFDKYL